MNDLQIGFVTMKESEWRIQVQSLLEKAAESGEVNLAALAREVGWKPPALHNFRKRGYGDKEKVEKLESRLHQRGFGVLETRTTLAPEAQKDSDPNLILAGQFQSVADTLRADLP